MSPTDFKRKRIISPAERRRIHEEKVAGKPCRGCGARNVIMNGHHLLAGTRREDRQDAIVPLGGSGTVGCHGIYTSHHPGKDCRGRWRAWDNIAASIRGSLSQEEKAYIIGEVGDLELERRYPRRAITIQGRGGDHAA